MGPREVVQEFGGVSIFEQDEDYLQKMQFTFATDVGHATAVSKLRRGTAMDLPALTKAELAQMLFETVGLNKREAKDMVDAFFAEISDALERGESVKLTGFGNFQLRDKVSRPGRNPRTGIEVNIPERRVVTFRPSLKLKTTAE